MAQLGIDERFQRAEGLSYFTADGREFLDMTASYGALPFGHNPDFLVRAAREFLAERRPSLFKGNPNFLESEAAEALLDAFGAEHVIFTSGGAESVNLAIKAARLVTGRRQVIAFQNSYHGTTGEALRLTGNLAYQEAFAQSLDDDVLFCAYNQVEDLEAALEEDGDRVAAVIVEPVQGEGGVIPGTQEFLRRVRELCSSVGALLILDEIQTGLGRCGDLSRSRTLGVKPDLLLLSKGLAGGLAPIGCCLFDGVWDRRLDALHSSTFGGNGFAASLVPRVLRRMTPELFRSVDDMGRRLLEGLQELVGRYPELLEEARGVGLLTGLEFREEVRGGTPFLDHLVETFGLLPAAVAHVRHNHRVCLATTLNTRSTLRVTPALTVTETEVDRVIEALDDFLRSFSDCQTTRIVRHLIDKRLDVDHEVLKPVHLARYAAEPPPSKEDRVMFLVHPNSPAYLERFDPSFRQLTEAEQGWLARNLTAVIEPVPWHEFSVGPLAVCVLASPFLPAQITTLGRSVWRQEVELAARKARSLGARLVGLGGLLSVVTRDGQDIPDLGIGVTTGNSLTAFAAYEAMLELIPRHHRGSRPPVAMLGGYGNIGLALSELLLREGYDVVLFGNPENPLRGQMLAWARKELESRKGIRGRVSIGDSLKALGPEPFVVVTATSNPSFHLETSQLPAGSTVLDLAMPPNLTPEVAQGASHLNGYRIGRVRSPVELPDLWMLELSDTIYGCLAETIVLGLERSWGGYSRGPLRADEVLGIGERARAHGFRSAHDRVLSEGGTEKSGRRNKSQSSHRRKQRQQPVTGKGMV